jgi:hypothetical protein
VYQKEGYQVEDTFEILELESGKQGSAVHGGRTANCCPLCNVFASCFMGLLEDVEHDCLILVLL